MSKAIIKKILDEMQGLGTESLDRAIMAKAKKKPAPEGAVAYAGLSPAGQEQEVEKSGDVLDLGGGIEMGHEDNESEEPGEAAEGGGDLDKEKLMAMLRKLC